MFILVQAPCQDIYKIEAILSILAEIYRQDKQTWQDVNISTVFIKSHRETKQYIVSLTLKSDHIYR